MEKYKRDKNMKIIKEDIEYFYSISKDDLIISMACCGNCRYNNEYEYDTICINKTLSGVCKLWEFDKLKYDDRLIV